jgi:PAS domain S-box-containing protein
MAGIKDKSGTPKNLKPFKKNITRKPFINYQSLLKNLESGYAYHKIILDKDGKPVDFEYIEVNPAFEKLMKLKGKEIIGKRVTEVIPDFKKKKTNWIKFYGEVALSGKNKTRDFFSDTQKKWLHINAHCPEKGYFIAEFHDITKRKQAEISVLESNHRLNKIFESISDAFVSLDKNWCYTYMNKRAGEIFGRNPKDVIGKHIWTEFPEGLEHPFQHYYERAFKEQVFIQVEEYYSPFDKWFENRIYPSKDGLSIFFQDITERKKAEQELKKAIRTYTFISQINQMIVKHNDRDEILRKSCEIAVEIGKFRMAWIGLLDENTQEVNPFYWSGVENGYLTKIKKITLKNEPALTGPTSTAIKEGRYCYCNNIAEDPIMVPWREDALSRGYHSSISLPIKLNNKVFGAYNLYSQSTDFFDNKEIRLLIEVADDISYAIDKIENETVRKRAEDSLRESEKFLTSIVENIPDMIFIKDAEKLKFIKFNKAGENLLGYKREDLLGKNDYDLFPKEQADSFIKNDYEVLKNKRQITIPEEPIDTKTGRRILQTNKIPIMDSDGKTVFLLGISEDITERIESETKLKESELRYRTIFENTGTATVIIEEDTLISLANSKFVELSGYSKQEIQNKIHWVDFVVKEDLEIMVERHKQRRVNETKTPKSYEFRFIDKSGIIKDVLITIDMIPGTKKSVASLLDISERKSVENKLRESEKRYRMLFEYNPLPVLIYERETLQLIDVNEAFLKHYGYNKEQVLSMFLTDLYPEEQKNPIKELTKNIQGHAYAGEWQHRKADGTLIDILATSHDIDFKNKKCRIAVINDITERNKSDIALRESEEKYRTLINASIDGIIITKEEKIQFVNNVLMEVAGYKEHELIGKQFLNFVSLRDREKVKNNYSKRIKGESAPLGYEINAILKNGKELPVEITSTVFNFFGEKAELIFVRDITERKEAERKILQNRQELDSIYNTVGDVIFLIRIEEENKFRFVSVNKTFSDVTGLESSLVVGKFVDEVIPEPSLSIAKDNYHKVIQRRSIVRWEETTVYPSGQRTGEVSVAPVFDLEGKCTHLVGSVHDVTERKMIEDKINMLNLELEDRVRVRTKQLEETNDELEAFAYSVSHDLRAPLRAISGFSNLLKEEYYAKFDDEGKEYLADIMTNSERMAKLIDDLLELSRYGRKILEKTNINMKELFVSILEEEKEYAINKNIVFNILHFPNTIGDYSLIKQVAVNLLSNAIKYSSKNPEPVIEIGSVIKEKEIVYYVKDNGVGFNMKYVHKLFGVFQRLHNLEEYDGTGVGLAIVKRIINKHGGKVWAESEQGKGATFYFTLPQL